MVTLTRKQKPDPTALYEVIAGFAAGNRAYGRGVKLRGDNPIVAEHPDQFMRADLGDDEKGAAQRGYWAASYSQMAPSGPPPPPRAYPPSGKMRAVAHYTIEDEDLGGPRPLYAGTVVDAGDPLYRRFPHLFRPVAVEERGR